MTPVTTDNGVSPSQLQEQLPAFSPLDVNAGGLPPSMHWETLLSIGLGHSLTGNEQAQDADRDRLTGLPNETRLCFVAGQALNQHHPIALMLINIDHFRAVNDGLGRRTGDALLVDISRRFAAAIGSDGLLARLGAAQFAFLYDSGAPNFDPLQLSERLHQALVAAFEIDGRYWSFTCSVGITVSATLKDSGKRYESIYELLHDADLAMSRAKKDGRDRTVLFDTGMHAAALARLNLEADVRSALSHEEFELHLQPIVRLADGRIKAFEALARWRQRPDDGFVPPLVFIPVLEQTGLIIPFGRWVIRRACEILRAWQQCLPESDCPVLAVNLSVGQFDDPDLFHTIREAVEATGVPPSSLRFEVTESLTMQDLERGAALLSRLAELGFGVSLDDFGTGYSSLGYLRSLPVDSLKIDRSFVAAMQDESGSLRIIRAVLSLAASIGLTVVAEGIETEEQAMLLAQLGCPYGQGYHFGRPASFTEATELLLRDRNRHADEPVAAGVAAEAGKVAALPPGMPLRNQISTVHANPHRVRGMDWATSKICIPLLAVAAFMMLHAGLILTFPRTKSILSEACLAIGPAVAAITCFLTGWRTQTVLRSKWMLTSLAFGFWSAGSVLATWTPMGTSADAIDFFYFLSSVTLLFAITAPVHEQPRRLFVAMDGCQALLGALLGFIVIFGKAPFSTGLVAPMSEQSLLWTYDVENVAMAALAALRLFGSDRSAERRRYDSSILVYTFIFGPLCSLYNHMAPASSSVMDVMLDPASFLMAIKASRSIGSDERLAKLSTPITAFLDCVGPVFLTLAVLVAGACIIQQRPVAGIVSILAAVTIYASRVSLLQARYLVAHQQLRQTKDQMERLTLEDSLTRVGNRRAYNASLETLWAEARRTGTPLSGMLIDVDHFKLYNDTYGHPAGDACLACIAGVLREAVECHGGQVARYGGEEFVVLLPNVPETEAREIALHIRQAVAAMNLTARAGAPAPATVSIGVATVRPPGAIEALLLAMDDALYRAKRKGRDRVEVERVGILPVAGGTIEEAKLDLGHQAAWQSASAMAR